MIFLAKNQTYYVRIKRIDVKYHYMREVIENNVVLLKMIDTRDNPSDMLTKVISGIKFQYCSKLIQILWMCWIWKILNYSWLDPRFWVRKQSEQHNHFGSLMKDIFGDDGSLIIDSNCDKSSLRWIIVEKSIKVAAKFEI